MCAAKFTKRGMIKVSARTFDAGKRVAVMVEDTGMGIAKGKLAAIFLPFEQVGQAGHHCAGPFGGSERGEGDKAGRMRFALAAGRSRTSEDSGALATDRPDARKSEREECVAEHLPSVSKTRFCSWRKEEEEEEEKYLLRVAQHELTADGCM
eukprot:1148228-Pelagomonas_calceolata.AAC.2